ncbi:MAG: TolC family protein [Gammaproteobacteria bacterium]|jgi:NodT family efflux transporter outer membrane factor (OMF) lipoprotein
MPYSRTAGLAVILLLAACAGAREAPPAAEIAEQAPPETAEVAASPGPGASWSEVIAEGAVGEGWLKSFNDPELEKIVAEALRNNRRPAVARANLEIAGQHAVQAVAALAPAVAVGGGVQSTEPGEATAKISGAALNVHWEPDIWDRLSSAAAAAEEDFRAPEADLESARQSLAAQTAKAWFLVTEANLQLALTREAVDIYAQTLNVVETRVVASAASPQDILRVNAALSASRERQRQAIGALIEAMRSIEAILGRYPSAELEVVREFVPVPPPIPAGIPAQLLERRPDLIAADRRVAAAFQRTESARATKLPSLPLTAAGGSASDELIDLVGAGSNFFSLGANFVAPLDAGGRLQEQVRIETAQQEAALTDYGAVALRAFGEVENALTNENLLRQREEVLAAAVDNNAAALSAARAQYDAGATEILSVLRMQARALGSRISLIRIENARLAQHVDLHLALGGDFSE